MARPFFLTASSSDDHSTQDDHEDSRNLKRRTRDPPPSSFTFPFQSYPGNPDPIPGTSRRRSLDSVHRNPFDSPRLPTPNPPFVQESPYKSFNGSFSLSNLQHSQLPRASSATTIFRSPFLSPASRPSSIWSPPPLPPLSANPSVIALPLTQKKPLQSTRLKAKLTDIDKPWLAKKRRCESGSWWVTFFAIILGIVAAAALCFQGWTSVDILQPSQLCLVMQDDFTSSLDSNNWSLDVELGGFGNGEFEMTTEDPSNVYISNGQLYIMPTLTSDSIDGGYTAVMDGGTYQLPGCTAGSGHSNSTSSNSNPCTAVSSAQSGTVINPVMSGRLNTRGKQTIKYGRVEVRAKLPQGDWLWPAIWMLPQGNSTGNSSQGTGVYGAWPISGEIDATRGNLPSYPAQGSNYVRSSLNYGPFAGGSTTTTANLLKSIYGWVSTKRGNFADGFHVYAFEWTGEWMRFYTDDRLQAMINLKISSKSSDSYFFNVGGFPGVAMNASSGKEVVVEDPWSTAYGGSAAAPFDQDFYLVIDLAVGGTSGWFPDSVGGKMWYDGSATAMRDFAAAQSTWSATWPSSADERAFRIDYVKMWKLCGT
ncbi:concanavalin A-like lectin/glucanase domain-containing protein [Suillus clintonianus]|uniref:concanavalin A-like lectin/glucanase domain-containing protein n=1 Tax=Suillus clintonianus TaxID=1904413 RepID=UPI001B863B0F|nr:concanavalin A-like lectin/glucanase domain-containing protein [Suillus clintonianus]KAG2127998.1 concanavalin A-like lectin/glucanase domain-containing protein [Suillus clintonianus]